jgi:hypothetical protein
MSELKMRNLEFEKVLVVCTSHVTKEDMEHLEQLSYFFQWSNEGEGYLEVLDYKTGVLLYVFARLCDDRMTYDEYITSLFPDWGGVGTAVKNLYDLASRHDCSYLRLDRDGPEIEGLPVFDW